jgi:hypothetical protein
MAMHLLQTGVDRAVIALWPWHESVETTQIYLEANLAMKDEILAKTTPVESKAGRYRPDDRLPAFLKSLLQNDTEEWNLGLETSLHVRI